MCNPRRVIIKLAQAVSEEWSRTVDAHAAEQTEIEARAMLETQVNLAEELGDIALQELRALLADGYSEWCPDGNAFALAMENGITLRYTPEKGILQVMASLNETVETAASASSSASGTVEGSIEVEGIGRYYSDGWGGHTEEWARERAQQDAHNRLSEAQYLLREEQQRAALEAAHRVAQDQARTEAQHRLREEAERRQALLQEEVETLLRDSEEQVQAAIGGLLGQTYRRALIRLVQEGGGQIVQDDEQEAVIELIARI
jgi:hypothetical protein